MKLNSLMGTPLGLSYPDIRSPWLQKGLCTGREKVRPETQAQPFLFLWNISVQVAEEMQLSQHTTNPQKGLYKPNGYLAHVCSRRRTLLSNGGCMLFVVSSFATSCSGSSSVS